MNGIHIREVRVHLVNITRKTELLPKTSHGSALSNDYVVIEVETNDGVVGVGEVTCAVGWNGEEAIGSVDLLRRKIVPSIIGLSVDDWDGIFKSMEQWVRHRPFLKAGIEMACLDAEGKTKGTSVADILGGALRKDFRTKLVLPARETEVVRGMAKIALERGGTSFKVKVGLDIVADRERLSAVREVIGDHSLLVDANEGWRPEQEDDVLKLISDFNIVAIEQPYPRHMAKESARLQAATPALLMADESVWTSHDVARIAEEASFKVVSLYPGKQGGIRACLAAAKLATKLGLEVSLGSNLETGIGSAAMAHFLALVPVLCPTVPSDLLGPLYFEEDLVLDSSWIKWTGASLPTGPGLGIEIDNSAVKAHEFSVTI